MMAMAKHKVSWFQTFMPLYEKVAPLVLHITNIENIERGELPLSPEALMHTAVTIRPALEALRKMPEPKERELRKIKKEFEIALSNCIKAAESAAKYVKLGIYGIEGQIQLNNTINSIVLAHGCMESVSKQLEPMLKNEVITT